MHLTVLALRSHAGDIIGFRDILVHGYAGSTTTGSTTFQSGMRLTSLLRLKRL